MGVKKLVRLHLHIVKKKLLISTYVVILRIDHFLSVLKSLIYVNVFCDDWEAIVSRLFPDLVTIKT